MVGVAALEDVDLGEGTGLFIERWVMGFSRTALCCRVLLAEEPLRYQTDAAGLRVSCKRNVKE